MQPWIGVDFDGTLAHYEHWQGFNHVGAPIQPMCDRVRRWLAEGHTVKVFTARVHGLVGEELFAACAPIIRFCQREFGRALDITNVKDFGMVELWDDRAVQVVANKGEPVGMSTRGLH